MKSLIKALSLCFGLILLISWMNGEDQERIIIQAPFKVIKSIYPDYPEILKKEGVAAKMLINITIDKKGNVTRTWTHFCLYPELHEMLEDVFFQWKFEPFIYKGEPIKAFGWLKVIFFPGNLSPSASKSDSIIETFEEELAIPLDKELQMVLDRCAEYCLKLSESALYYICHERIKENTKRIIEDTWGYGGGLMDLRPDQHMVANFEVLSMGKNKRHNSVYDYQLIRKQGTIQEQRIPMEKNKETVDLEDLYPETKPIYSIKSIFVPVQLLGIEQRSKFSFNLADDEKIKGEPSYVVEAFLKPGQTGNIKQGKIWVDKTDFRVIKTEVESDFVEGYEHILEECSQYYLNPHFKSTHYYDIEKNDLLFPGRSEIRVEYSGFYRYKRELKSEIKIEYNNYKFFIVETDHNIIKKKMYEYFLQRNRFNPLILKSFPVIKK